MTQPKQIPHKDIEPERVWGGKAVDAGGLRYFVGTANDILPEEMGYTRNYKLGEMVWSRFKGAPGWRFDEDP